MLSLLLLLLLPLVAAVVPGDDMSTELAKQIIRSAKAAEIKSRLDTSVQPCDNFYNYACGNWKRQNPAQLLANVATDTFEQLSSGFERRLLRLLQSAAPANKLEQQLQDFHKSCLRLEPSDADYKQSLRQLYSEFGELPVLSERWNDANYSWWRQLGAIAGKYNIQPLISVDILNDMRNSSLRRVYVGPPRLSPSLSAADIKGNSMLAQLEMSGLQNMLETYLELSAQQASALTLEMLQLRKQLSEGSGAATKAQTLAEEVSELTLVELQQLCGSSELNMTEFLGLVLGAQHVPAKLYVYQPAYLQHVLATLAQTPAQRIANYVLWQLLEPFLLLANKRHGQGQGQEQLHWCVKQTRKHFGELSEHLIYARYRSDAAESEVHAVWQQMRATFRQQLAGDKLDWMAPQTRQLAIEKLERMQLHILAYDAQNFEQLYGQLALNASNYVRNLQQLLQVAAARNVAQLTNSSSSSSGSSMAAQHTEVLSFTPAYSMLDNCINIPVALLQPHYFWAPEYPKALRYATLGYLLGHELIHGFDDDGRNYDAAGNLSPWWDERSRYEYDERRKCFQAQYHQFRYDGLQLPNLVEQSENIADNGGIKLAYQAYQSWLQQQPAAQQQLETLPGLEHLNPNQLFFVSYAQLWCADVQSLFRTWLVAVDEHAPSMFRVVGPLSNFQEFSWVFNCSQAAPMDPEYKCAIY
ncbi:neprilysin-4 [Drosophila busckii]|nr:neprilysin-4 [Drosophila busckii]